jgi:hypothetical protein
VKELVFIHGRSQEHKDAAKLKAEWIAAWKTGLQKSENQLPIAETAIHFPYYGDTLDDLVKNVPAEEAAKIVIKGHAGGRRQQDFVNAVLMEVAESLRISPEEIAEASGEPVIRQGPVNWKWVHGILRLIDQKVKGGSGAAVALFTNDVYQYLMNPNIGTDIDTGVGQAIKAGVPTVVVSHSLGTVVAYRLFTRCSAARNWQVPLFVTLGSPLGIKAIHDALSPVHYPVRAQQWYNAMDTKDVVALYPLDNGHFNVTPDSIENNTSVENDTPNHHGITGYLNKTDVAMKIYDALK